MTQRRRIHGAALTATRIDRVLLDHLVEHAVVVALDDGAVPSRSSAILIDEATDA